MTVTTTKERWRFACPSCESRSVCSKSPKQTNPRTHPEDYYCDECYAHFDEPVDLAMEGSR